MSLKKMMVETEAGTQERKISGRMRVSGGFVEVPEVRHDETMIIGADGAVKIAKMRNIRKN